MNAELREALASAEDYGSKSKRMSRAAFAVICEHAEQSAARVAELERENARMRDALDLTQARLIQAKGMISRAAIEADAALCAENDLRTETARAALQAQEDGE
jgi:capsid protein